MSHEQEPRILATEDSTEVWGVDIGSTKAGQRARFAYVCEPGEWSKGQPTLFDSGAWLSWN